LSANLRPRDVFSHFLESPTMSKPQQSSALSPPGEADPSPPRGLNRSEKVQFQRICRMRRDAGKPVSALEVDIIRDYLDARARLEELQRVEWTEQARPHFFLSERIKLASAIDRAASSVRRLAKDLGLVGS